MTIHFAEFSRNLQRVQRNCSVLMTLELHETIRGVMGSALCCGLIADPYIHVNGSNSVRLSAGSVSYCGLMADPYIHINGSNSVRLAHGVSLVLWTDGQSVHSYQ